MACNARRKLLRERAAARAAAGLPPVRPPRRSHYLTVDIRDAVQADLLAMRLQMEAQRDGLHDREWAFRPEKDVPGPIKLFEGLNLPVRSAQ